MTPNRLYCDVIVKRWEEQTAKMAVLEGSKKKISKLKGGKSKPIRNQPKTRR